ILIGPGDALLAGITQEGARMLDAAYEVSPAANYYFLSVSTFLVTIAGALVTEKIIAPRLGKYKAPEGLEIEVEDMTSLKPNEKRGLMYAGVVLVIITIVFLAGLLPEYGFFLDPKTGSILTSSFLSGIVSIIFFASVLLAIAYGIGAR